MKFFCSLTQAMVDDSVQNLFTSKAVGWECRLDLLSSIPPFLTTCEQVWMATYRTVAHGGQGEKHLRNEQGWQSRMEAVRLGASWLDLELDEECIQEKMAEARAGGAKTILSAHYFDSKIKWEDTLENAARHEPDLIKLIGMGANFRDYVLQRDLYKACQRPLVHFFMGQEFQSTRLLSLWYGAPLTYFSPTIYVEPAPGQIHENHMDEFLEMDVSKPLSLFAIAGYPVAHSMSPAYHQPKLRQVERNSLFLNFPIENAEELRLALQNFPELHGLSITKPLKEIASHVATPCQCNTENSKTNMPPVNTLIPTKKGLRTANTDCMAIRNILYSGEILPNKPVIRILGIGGLGKAAIKVAIELGFKVQVSNRSAAKVDALREEGTVEKLKWEDRHNPGCDILFQATSCGMGDTNECPLDYLPAGTRKVIETIYHPRETRLLRMAKTIGLECVDGQTFFFKQAEYQNQIFLDTLGEP